MVTGCWDEAIEKQNIRKKAKIVADTNIVLEDASLTELNYK